MNAQKLVLCFVQNLARSVVTNLCQNVNLK
jgi:hypothetical protein